MAKQEEEPVGGAEGESEKSRLQDNRADASEEETHKMGGRGG